MRHRRPRRTDPHVRAILVRRPVRRSKSRRADSRRRRVLIPPSHSRIAARIDFDLNRVRDDDLRALNVRGRARRSSLQLVERPKVFLVAQRHHRARPAPRRRRGVRLERARASSAIDFFTIEHQPRRRSARR